MPLYFRIFKKSTNRLKYLSSYKEYINSLKRYYSSTIPYKDYVYNPEVLEVLREDKPVAALQTTMLSQLNHGSQYPQNLAKAIIVDNAKIGNQKCLGELSNLKLELKDAFKRKAPTPPFLKKYEKLSSISNQELMIVGGTVVDITSTLDPLITDYIKTSSPGTIRQSIGGVGRNIAETSFRLGVNPLFISAIGNDLSGNWLKTKFEKIGMETNGLQIINNESTAIYNAIHDPNGNLICAVADMKIFDSISSIKISQIIKMTKPKLVCFDGNISVECIYSILNTCNTYNISTFFETTSIPKSLKLLKNHNQFTLLLSSQSLKYISPNSFELKTMYFKALQKGFFDSDLNSEWIKKINEYDIKNLSKQNFAIEALISSSIDYQLDIKFISELFIQTLYFLPYIPNIIVKLGENGILLAQCLKDLTINNHNFEKINNNILKNNKNNEIIIKGKNEKSGLRFKYFKPISFDKNEIINVTGAGDSVVGTIVSGLILHDKTKIDKIIEIAQYIALMTLKSHNSVSEDINEKLLQFNN
ncbi:Ribokinase-like protein [Glomus cerebriforme]|uniref:Ribokinase-like protein n=1 Tax=Glomus cerebriforme TaxID=658196 RepID=A0A397SAM1_9GLOM|nr:Ribokinase-like protein [Glomus cerebriforme]